MVHARVQGGRLELLDPLPAQWEGLPVKIVPLSPDDDSGDLEERLSALTALGPVEYDPGEREEIAAQLEALDAQSRAAMCHLTDLAQ